MMFRTLHLPDAARLKSEDYGAIVDSISTSALSVPYPDLMADCLPAIETVIKAFPERATLRGTRGGLLFELGRYDEAERDLTYCLEKGPDSIDCAISGAYLAALARMREDTAGQLRFEQIVRESGANHPIIERMNDQALADRVTETS
jgi:hypothetical protein